MIRVKVNKRGETQVTVHGTKGGSCVEETRFLENSLGKRISEQLTTEYFEEQHTTSFCPLQVGDNED